MSKNLHNHSEFVWHIATTAPVNASTHAVLNAILLAKSYNTPHVNMYFSTLGRMCGGKDRKDVKAAIKKLEREGILVCEGEKVHGRGLANTYEIVDVTGVIPTWEAILKRGESQAKTGGKTGKNGGKVPPQTYNRKYKKGGASAHKDAPRRGGGDKVDADRAEELRLFSREVDEFGYGEARRREKAREAAEQE